MWHTVSVADSCDNHITSFHIISLPRENPNHFKSNGALRGWSTMAFNY